MALDRDIGITVPLDAYPFLQLQRGAISDFAADNPAIWLQHYINSLYSEFECIEPYLPLRCCSILDVGSGLGGINALLNRHYGGDCKVTLLDGVNDPARLDSHATTFNSMAVARAFLAMNGVEYFGFVDASAPELAMHREVVDLVISFRSWCFHFEPETYLELVKSWCVPGKTKLLIDVRRTKPEWESELRMAFRFVSVVYQGAKFATLLLEAR